MGEPSDDDTSRVPSAEEGPPREAAPVAPGTTDPGRRRALEMLVAAGSAVYAGALAVPASKFLEAPSGTSGARWLRVARLDELKEDAPARLQLRGEVRDAFTVTADVTLGSVWLRRRGGEVLALSAECPHLGCAVDLTAGGASFGCPCHTSRFELDGKASSGPSPRGMDPLATRVVDGWIEVEFRRYRQGTSARVEVGS